VSSHPLGPSTMVAIMAVIKVKARRANRTTRDLALKELATKLPLRLSILKVLPPEKWIKG
jgi:hypothetical protein